VKGKASSPHFDPLNADNALFMVEENVQNSAGWKGTRATVAF
jgi:hypothetical protein